MNLIVIEPEDFVAADRVRLIDRRLVHARKHLRLAAGDRVRVGLVDEARGDGEAAAANLGHGEVLRCDHEALELRVELGSRPPAPSLVTLAIALPRPHTLEKVLQQGTALGVKRFIFFHSRRVEKSYWGASAIEPAAVRRQLLLGLEQCVDTVVPQVELHPRFLPFVEDRLVALRERGPVLVADPEGPRPCPRAVAGPLCLVLGPEGGFVPFERARLLALGHELVSLGPRILRVETAAIALLARLAPDRVGE
ncbi:Ribosomal RNA small subunit methyltransferase E [Enhygromyxa salina]|uniref:Ribosomal RNA small subunit methyltransferase E n=1 Tax=Enhygromyxa salina TaxID=215803 RepID=A0A0C2D1U3_9BACT|nr:RsmE family RNA methyltransferase [Enhygromyxa salina]KIG14127.1 Ribosomal RNA small subunit methyltransferase E [Enhygromyxa salina]